MRHPTYMGPKTQIQPSELDRFESSDRYVAEEKHDGHWCEVTTDSSGQIVSMIGRSGTKFSGEKVAGLMGFQVGIAQAVFICELEAGTEAANKRNAHLPHRRLWVFDVVKLLNTDVTHLPYEDRRRLIEASFSSNQDRIMPTRMVTKSFRAFFDEVAANDGEGLVLKRLGKPYKPTGAVKKTEDWIRCKLFRYVDYVVMEIGKSDGGSPNLQVGLYMKGGLKRVATIKNLPEGLDYRSLVGKVVECKGAEVHDSGALRHGHYERTRDDKDPEECTLGAALEA